MKKIIVAILLIPLVSFGQDSQDFTRNKEFYVRGNTAVVGNNMLSKHSKKSFDDLEKVNDEFKMKYVDIDDDGSTWSSSSAFLELKEEARVVYAGLYWSGTYHGERSSKRIKDSKEYFKKLEDRAHDLQEVKLKMSGGEYQDVRGSLIYDGMQAQNNSLSSRAPYACMADVTSFFQGAIMSQIKGQITVANVSATEGQLIGGSSAGWLLYVVYEDNTQPYQYITTFDGFEFINKQTVEVNFGNFQSSDQGELETAVTIGALEGDSNLGRDQVGIFDPESKVFVTLDNKVRASSNFFNSTITVNDQLFNNRIPNSQNTLGFDLAKIKIPTAQNDIIAHNAGGVKMQFKTRSDRFFLFFTAFQTTISKQFYEEKNDQQPVTILEEQDLIEAPQKPKPNIVNQPVAIAKPKLDVAPKTYKATDQVNEELGIILEKPSVRINEIGAGYYLVTNVFSNIDNATRWIDTLKKRNLEPQMFYKPDTKLIYVFIDSSREASLLYTKLTEIRKQEDLKKAWILKINLD